MQAHSTTIWAGVTYADCPATRADEKRLARELAFFLESIRRTVGGGSDALACPACGQTVDGGTCWNFNCDEGFRNIQAEVACDMILIDWPPVEEHDL